MARWRGPVTTLLLEQGAAQHLGKALFGANETSNGEGRLSESNR